MDSFQVSIEALVAFRDHMVRYRNRVADVFDAATAEINRAVAQIEDIESDWRRAVARRNEACQQCHRAALHAAMDGGWVDCSGYDRALEDAEAALAHVLRFRRQMEAEIDQFRNARLRYGEHMDGDCAGAIEYVRECIEAFTRFGTQSIMAPGIETKIQHKKPFVPTEPGSVGTVGDTATGGPSPERREGAEQREGGAEGRG